jgi:enamine deaminase RidA (YjgF/YER057c/UK114 family)
MTRKPAFQASPSNPNIQEIQTEPERRVDMPYAPAMRVESPCGLLFISGATPSPLYHKHPHVISEHDHPNRIEDQTRRAMETIKTILEHQGLTWTDVVKVSPCSRSISGRGHPRARQSALTSCRRPAPASNST